MASPAQLARYGPQFNYDEFVAMPGRLSSFAMTSALILGFGLLALVQPVGISLHNELDDMLKFE